MNERVKIKVCGIMDAAFAKAAESRGVDCLGFVFAPGSPRRVSPETARAIAGSLAGRAKTVGVFAGVPIAAAVAMALEAGVDIVQLHGGYTASDCRLAKAAGFGVWMLDEGGETPPEADGILVDGRDGAKRGGTGKTADWERARELAAKGVFTILAGGLGEANAPAAAQTGCAVLDFNSSLELSPGRKSLAKLDALLERFRSERAGGDGRRA
ncbi:MAG: phosphoribosylanthranilate isomerase [Kiritimatiellae bacterium]|nr:phosphoribosylanthranilate isomerase [Kiritimatiellia bacterium]